jgi:hypothetical protein
MHFILFCVVAGAAAYIPMLIGYIFDLDDGKWEEIEPKKAVTVAPCPADHDPLAQ